jgi:hypothetical protein
MRTPTLISLALALALVACGAPAVPPAETPAGAAAAAPPAATAPAPAAPPSDPFVPAAPLREEAFEAASIPALDPALTLPDAPAGLAAVPAECKAFVARKASRAPSCDAPPAALDALDAGLAEGAADTRDARLAGLEACRGLPAGLVRALRADLAPPACADALVAPLLAKPPAALRGDVQQVLLGEALAARLVRLQADAPRLQGPLDKKRLTAHLGGPVKEWLGAQAAAVQAISSAGVKLRGYGRAIVATAAGIAELRVVEAVRALPLPDDMAKDEEIRNIYYAGLDEALEPRKARGRDAALVGLRDFAAIGALSDARVTRARALLSTLYGGRRIDALDALALPPLASPDRGAAALRLAAALPAFYAGVLLDPLQVKDPALLRALLERGLPEPHRRALRAAELSPEASRLAARARLGLARLYWRAVDADEAAALLARQPKDARGEEGDLLLALAIALRGGPEDAAAMIRSAPVAATGVGQVAALDALAATPPPARAALAAFDAAVVLDVARREGERPAYFRELAARYAAAAAKLDDPALRKEAAARAKAAEDAAAAIGPR